MNEFDAAEYTINIKRAIVDGEHTYYASVRELPHVSVYGATYGEAYEETLEVIATLHAAAKEHGLAFPNPEELEAAYSGRITLRIPVDLHRSAARLAAESNTSLNTFISTLIAEGVGR
jgi:predicted RNase H-like HicB family nuclease